MIPFRSRVIAIFINPPNPNWFFLAPHLRSGKWEMGKSRELTQPPKGRRLNTICLASRNYTDCTAVYRLLLCFLEISINLYKR